MNVRAPVGFEDILLLESGPPGLPLAVELLTRLAHDDDGNPVDSASLGLGDVDVLMLRLRQQLIGDLIRAEEACAAPDCHARVDISFSIAAYLEHHRPEMPPDVRPADDTDWFALAGDDVEFRVPRVADQLALARVTDPEQELVRRCLRPTSADAGTRERVEQAMEIMAPILCSDLEGVCPDCGAGVEASFDPLLWTLLELRERAAHVYEDVCLIASHCHWSEAEILALPAARRSRYAELAARAGEESSSAATRW